VSDDRVRYARNGDVHLAYRVFGEGDVALVWVPGWVSNVGLYDDPGWVVASVVESLARQIRLVVWDKRGTGLSDPVMRVPTLDERMDDLNAVLAAVDVDRPALLGVSEGGPMTILFAATYPERVRSLVLYGTAARFTQELPDFPWGMTPTTIDRVKRSIDAHWGEGRWARILLGETADVPGVHEMVGRWEHTGASPTMAALLVDAFTSIDVRDVLKSVRTPTLVLSRPGDQMVPFGASAALAAGIPGAVFRPLPPGAHAAFDIDDSFVTEVLGFVCERPSLPNERVLATVLFTDIVGSTELLSSQGDERWRRQLDVHDKLVDGLLSKYDGRHEKHTGDGVFAIFDGPTKAARCGLELVPALAARGMCIRVGIHTGECERRGTEWSGMAIHVGARIAALAGANEVLTSRTVRDLSAGSLLNFESIGPQHLKGVPEDVDVYRVRAA